MSTATILVTGAASGLGAATLRKLTDDGMNVVAIDLDVVPRDQLTKNTISLACDVTREDEVADVIAKATETFGQITGLVCCAGIATGSKLVGKHGPHPIDLFRKTLEVNVVGTFNLMRLGAAAMMNNTPGKNGERGVIVTTASVAAFEGQIGQIAYAASKGAVASMTLPAARELAQSGIRVATIAPGVFDTPMMQGLPEHVRDAIGATVPFPAKLGDPGDFGALVAHILSNQTINGEVIRLDGALRMAAK